MAPTLRARGSTKRKRDEVDLGEKRVRLNSGQQRVTDEKLPIEMMALIFEHTDLITGTSLALTRKAYYALYKEKFAKILRPQLKLIVGNSAMLMNAVPLWVRCVFGSGREMILAKCLASWFPDHLTWDQGRAMFVGPRALAEHIARIRNEGVREIGKPASVLRRLARADEHRRHRLLEEIANEEIEEGEEA